jgi:hypothetical protein
VVVVVVVVLVMVALTAAAAVAVTALLAAVANFRQKYRHLRVYDRVAKWFIFIPKIPILGHFLGIGIENASIL